VKPTAIYARYSSSLQRETSIEDQVALCRSAAARFGCVVAEEHVYVDQEISGSESRRDGYQRLLAAARQKAFEAILVEDQSRLWRDIEEAARALKRLRFLGISVFSVASGTNLADEKTGSLISIVTAWKDATYLSDLADRTRRGLAGQARRGFVAGGRSYGYTSEAVVDPDHVDVHGQPRLLGYRRLVDPEQAKVVLRIHSCFADGWSPKRIVLQLNPERISPPRGTSWTWTTIYGNPKLGTGILNNPLYIGDIVWNKFRWERNPETGKRVPRLRPRDEWIVQHDESLRIVPQELWERVKQHQRDVARKSAGQTYRGGRYPKYLFSGLLKCGLCGANYVLRNGAEYGCSFHTNRGVTACRNGLGVKRRLLEDRLLNEIRHQLFRPDAIAYALERANQLLQARARESRRSLEDRHRLETELRDALAKLGHIRDAIERGLLSDLTKQMLDEAEERVRTLRGRLENPVAAQLHTLRLVPRILEDRLGHLRRVLGQDTELARKVIAKVLDEIVLRPTPKGLVAQLRGNLEGLLTLGEQAPLGFSGSGGWI